MFLNLQTDIKEIVTEKFIRQKLNYMHKNPVSGKWKLVNDYLDYVHSSARFYDLGEKGIYDVIHYEEAMKISAESSEQTLFKTLSSKWRNDSAETSKFPNNLTISIL